MYIGKLVYELCIIRCTYTSTRVYLCLSNMYVCVRRPSVMSDFASPWPIARQVPLSMGFPRQNTGVGCHFLLQGSSQPRDQTQLSCVAGGFFTI